MNAPTLASLFDQCAQALKQGRAAEALDTLQSIRHAAMSPAAAALHRHLEARAQRAALAGGASLPPPVVQVPQGGMTLLRSDQQAPVAGYSLVSACMNRQDNLLKVLPSWLDSGADEIIIVDWSSHEPVWPLLSDIDDPRLKVVRIDGEKRWILTQAFNVGLRMARHEVVFKLDADIRISRDFLAHNPVQPGTFVRGFWKSAVDAGEAEQKYINGSFGARKQDLRAIGYYNERILTYGWDDSDLYGRLAHDLGLAGHLLAYDSLTHLDQAEGQRLENQDVRRGDFLGRYAPTEFENITNKYDTLIGGDWGASDQAQDFALVEHGPRLCSGERITAPRVHVKSSRRLAEALAARYFAVGWPQSFPTIAWDTLQDLEFSRLLSDAKRQARDTPLVEALRERRGVHLFRCAVPALRTAVRHTLSTLRQHHTQLAQAIFIVEDPEALLDANPAADAPALYATGGLIDSLGAAMQARTHTDVDTLERVLLRAEGACTTWEISYSHLAESALTKAESISQALAPRFHGAGRPAEHTAFVTSVYDEQNLVRLIEYLACVVLNLRVVQRMLLCYESRNGLFQMVMQQLCKRLDLPPQRMALLPLDGRPTFETLFAFQSLLPHGTLLAVCNADVAFDGTFHALQQASDKDTVYAVSRWDISEDHRSAEPIRIENGTPNTFSADAWVVTTPFEPDFFLDYPIGTIHCDSFINFQVSRSRRYKVINPCLDVHVFHLHDSRFNSSAEKQVKLKEEIGKRWEAERLRNGGEVPIKGVPWSYLENADVGTDASLLLDWRPRALVLDMPRLHLGGLVWLHLAVKLLGGEPNLTFVIRLPQEAGAGLVGRLLARYKQHFHVGGLQFDFAGAPLRPDAPPTSPAHVCATDADVLVDVLAQGGVGLLAQRLDAVTQFPADPTIFQVRTNLHLGGETAAQLRLLRAVRKQVPQVLEELQQFVEALDPWGAERRLLKPFEAELFNEVPEAPAVHTGQPRVSLVTSLFRGDEFLPGYLENAAQAALQAQGEVVLVDANCNGHDGAAIERFFAEYPELRRIFQVVTLDSDPGLYACWQLAIERSRGRFISNANIDDRRSPLHTRRLVDLLESQPDLAAASGCISAVTSNAEGGWFDILPNQVWFPDMAGRRMGFKDLYATNADGSVRSLNFLHCMPVWRRELHQRYGYFDEARYGTSADWAFWLLCARDGQTFQVDGQAFGRYYLNPSSHNRRNDADGAKERRIIADLIGVQQDTVIKQ